MVARERLMAGWFVAILLLALVPATVPTAEAAPGPYGSDITSTLLVQKGGAGPWQVYSLGTHGRLAPGDNVNASWYLTIQTTGCTATVPGAPPVVALQSSKLDTTVLGGVRSADPEVQNGATASERRIFKNFTVASSSNTTNERDDATLTLTYNLKCTSNTADPADLNGQTAYANSPVFGVDTRPPTLNVHAPVWTNSTDPLVHANVPVTSATHPVGAGTTLRFWIFANDTAGVKTVTLDLVPIGGSLITITPPGSPVSYAGSYDYAVPVGTSPFSGSGTVVIRAIDTASNVVAAPGISLTVDNVPPTGGAASLGSDVRAAIARYRDGVSASVSGFTGAPYVQVRVNGNPASPTALAAGQVGSLGSASALSGTVDVVAVAVDAAGNPAATGPVLDVAQVSSFAYGEPPAQPQTVAGTRFGFVHLNVSGIPTPAFADVTARLELVGAGLYVNGTGDGSSNSHFTGILTNGPPTYFRPNVIQNNSAGTYLSFNGFNNRRFQDGEYRLNVTINQTSAGGAPLNATFVNATFKVDGEGPALGGNPTHYASGPSVVSKTSHVGDNNPLEIAINATEWRGNAVALKDSGLANITVELVDVNERGVIVDASNTPARIDFTRTTCASALTACLAGYPGHDKTQTMFNQTWFQGWVNLTFPDLPPGNYKVRVLATDVAGNTAARVYGATLAEQYKVRPRATLLTTGNLPVAHSDVIEVGVLAAYATAVSPPGTSCAPLCPVKEVTLQVKKQNAADSTALEVATIQQPIGQQQQMMNVYTGSRIANGSLIQAQQAMNFYVYTNATTNMRFVYPAQFDPTTGVVLVRAIARAIGPDGVTYETTTDWTTASSALAPTLNIRQPPVDHWINTTQRVPYNVSFEIRGTPFTPYASIEVLQRVSGVDVAYSTATVAHHSTASQQQPPRFFNYTGNLTNPSGAAVIPPGEYVMVMKIYDGPAMSGTPYLSTRRDFAVAPLPTVNFTGTLPTTNIYQGSSQFFVNRSFEIPVSVGHEAANISSDSAFTFTLEPAVRRPGAPASYTPGDGSGFELSIRQPVNYNPYGSRTNLRLQVTMPTDASDGEGFLLNVTAITDAINTAGAPYTAYAGIGRAPLRLDTSGPAAGVDRLETNATGNDEDPTKLAFTGYATDTASGTREVQVRIVNLTGNKTFVWTSGPKIEEPGETDRWATSLPQLSSGSDHYRSILLSNVSGQTRWTIGTTREKFDAAGLGTGAYFSGLSGFDRNATYRVDVRAVDNLGHVSLVSSDKVSFDARAPELDLVTGIVGPHVTDWHGRADASDVLKVYARDNNCLARVSLKGISPSGALVGPADFEPVGAKCRPYAGGNPWMEWRLDLSNAPNMTNEVTNATSRYTYWFEAEDGAGRITEAPTFRRDFEMEVRDVTPAMIYEVYVEPGLVATGSTARVVAMVIENAGIDRVEVNVVRDGKVILQNKRLVPDPLRPVAANGTGFYVADTDTHLNMSLAAGSYAFFVRASDINSAVTCGGALCKEAGALLVVSDDAPPAVVPELPPRDTTVINGTPTFQFRVLHPDVESRNITVSTGRDARNLTPVTATFAPRMSGTTRQGWDVTYKPAPITEAGDYVIRVTAKSSKTGFTNTTTLTYRVDPTAPNATADVTGTVTLNNKTWATSATRITLAATDDDGTEATLTYAINRGAAVPYTGPISPLASSPADGEWRLDYTATDLAGNVRTGTVTLLVDRTGPVITVGRHGDEVLLTVSDGTGVGVDPTNVTANYAYGAASAFTLKKAELLTGNNYNVTLGGNANATGLKYWFQARDALGNVATRYNASTPYVIAPGDASLPEDLAPTVRITSPAPGATVRNTVQLRWIAEDPEGQPLTVTLAIRDPAPGRVLLPAGENSGSFTLNLTGEPAGPYTVVVTATDGTNTAIATVTFTLERGQVIAPAVLPPATPPVNQALNFAVTITPAGKTVATATYTVQRDGATFVTGTLRQANGAWAGQVTPTEPGAYRIVVGVTYTDGTAEAPAQVGSFTVQGQPEAPPVGMPTSLLLLVVLGALTIALAAYGAFVRWK